MADVSDRMTAREAVLGMWDIVYTAQAVYLSRPTLSRAALCRSWQDLRAVLMYAVEVPSRKKRTPMNVEEMVTRWVPIIIGLSTAHDKAPIDQCEFDMEQHLSPLLTAPVAQIRAFYAALVDALKADPRAPFFVWSWFDAWGQVMLKDAPDGAIKELKTQLATEIADLVEARVQPDLKAAMIRALQWRTPEALTEIKTAVEAGGTPRVRGRESCLFLTVDTPAGDEIAKVML